MIALQILLRMFHLETPALAGKRAGVWTAVRRATTDLEIPRIEGSGLLAIGAGGRLTGSNPQLCETSSHRLDPKRRPFDLSLTLTNS